MGSTSNIVTPIPVSLVRCPDYEPGRVRRSIREALGSLGGMEALVSPGQKVLLKPNLLQGKPPEKAVTTHPEIVHAVALEIMNAGGSVFLGDSPGSGSLASVLSKSGIARVIERLGIEVVPFGTPTPVSVPEGGVYHSIELAGEVFEFDLVVNLPKLKTHAQMVLTLAVKNLFGTVVGAAKPSWHLKTVDDDHMAELLLDIYRTVAPRLNILDGVLGMEGNGPGSGDPREVGLLAASPSALALDMIVSPLLGVDPAENPVLRRAMGRGLPGSLPEQVRMIGLSPEEASVDNFILPASCTRVDFSLPDFISGPLKRSSSSYPVLDPAVCTTCGICEETCPVSAISLFDGGGGNVDKNRCISCFCCQEMCPEGAIRPVPGRLLKLLRRLGVA